MKLKKTVTALVLALALVGALTIASSAAGVVQEIRANLDPSITITLDGEAQTFLDANGTRVYPITYKGTTYLPVRAVAGLVGLGVDWDGTTRTVILGKQPSGVDLIETYNIYHTEGGHWECNAGQVRIGDKKTEEISGVSYSHWLYLNCAWGHEIMASYNLQGKHDSLTFTYYSNEDAILKITGDNGTVLGEFTITGGAVAKTVTIPLFKANELKFEVTPAKDRGWPAVRIVDAYLDAEAK